MSENTIFVAFTALPKFNGSGDVKMWTRRVNFINREIMKERNELSMDPERVFFLLHDHLVGEAGEWFRGLQSHVQSNFNEVLNRLEDHFESQPTDHIETKVYNLRQEVGESLSAYALRGNKLHQAMTAAPDREEWERIVTQLFISGIRDSRIEADFKDIYNADYEGDLIDDDWCPLYPRLLESKLMENRPSQEALLDAQDRIDALKSQIRKYLEECKKPAWDE